MMFGVETAREVGLGLSVKRKSVSQHQARISLLLRNQTATLLNLDNRPFSPVGPSQIHNTNKPPTTCRSLLMNIHYYGTKDNTQQARMPKIGDRMPTCPRAPTSAPGPGAAYPLTPSLRACSVFAIFNWLHRKF